MNNVKILCARLESWENSRGAYILSQKYRNELKDYLLTGNAKGLSNFNDVCAWCPICGDIMDIMQKKLLPNEEWEYECVGCDKIFKFQEVRKR